MRLFSRHFLLFLLSATFANAQLSTKHYIPPLPFQGESNPNANYFRTVHMYISTPAERANFIIKPFGSGSEQWISGVVLNNASYKVQLNNNIIGSLPVNPNTFNYGVTGKGYEVTSDREVYVSIRVKHNFHAGAIVSKGFNGLGKRFRVGAMERTGANNDMGFFSIVSVSDNNQISFTADSNLVALNGLNLPNDLILNNGESFVATFIEENITRFIGTLIESSEDIVVNTGTLYGSFSNEIIDNVELSANDRTDYFTGGDMGIDQLVSLDPSSDAKEYILVRGDSFTSIENALIIADSDNTQITINGVPYVDPETNIDTLNAGEHFFVEGNYYSEGGELQYMHIKSNNNIYVFQGTGEKYTQTQQGRHNYSANQSMFFVPPLNCASTGDVESIAKIEQVDDNTVFFGSLMVLSKAESDVTVNGQDINTLSSARIDVPINGVDQYQINRLDNLSGDVAVLGSDELYVSYYNVNQAASSGAFYSGFTLFPKIFPELTISQYGRCVNEDGTSNVVLKIPNPDGYDSIVWQKYDGSNWVDLQQQIGDGSEFTPTEIGDYRAVVDIQCLSPENILFSDPITLSTCPKDNDNDGINDNIDLDKDNDGILNSDESNGDILINLTDPTAPTTSGFTTPNSISHNLEVSGVLSSNVVDNQSFTGDANGNFTSTFPRTANINLSQSYNISFSEDVNIILTYNNDFFSSQNIVQEEFFVLESIDAGSNVSLINPNNQLLVDTNFDGAFEENIVYFNSSSIIFKFNPNNSESYNFEFIKSCGTNDGLVFKHHNPSSTESSIFNGNIRIFDYKSDSDNDNIPDSFELDSDADGCFDIREARYEDNNNDGIAGTVVPLTIDNGGVDERGRVVGHDYQAAVFDNNNDGLNDFQTFSNAPDIAEDLTFNQIACEGDEVVFSLQSVESDVVYLNVDDDNDGTYDNVYEMTRNEDNSSLWTYALTSVPKEFDNSKYFASLYKDDYACYVETAEFSLTVVHDIGQPTLDPLTVLCLGSTVGDFNVENVVWFGSESDTTPLGDDVVLEHNKTYYAAGFINGCIGDLRSETKVVINDPEISTKSGKVEFCIDESITLSLDTDKILPTPEDFARINNLVFIENANGPVVYDNGFYYTQDGITAGVQPITWTASKALGESIVGATMYVVNSAEEENLVYSGLQHMGLTGDDGIAFWLGLYQDTEANDYSEPDGGWYWVDGTPLNYQNWFNGEPNDYPDDSVDGEENYGQFEFSDNLIKWNDMNLTFNAGQSYPLFEYKAQTQVNWYTVDNGVLTEITGGTNSSEIVVSPNQTTTYVVRVTTNSVVCESEPFTVIVNNLPIAYTISDIEFCDDESDGDGNNGSITFEKDFFDNLIPEILGDEQNTNDFTVTFYETQQNAENAENTIIFPYTNPEKGTSAPHYVVNSTEIFVRVQNNATGCFDASTSFNLIVNPLPIVFPVADIIICDDDRDGFLSFDLDSRTDLLRSGDENTDPGDTDNQSANDFQITYHLSLEDANEISNSGLSSPFTNSVQNFQEIFYRIIKTDGNNLGCYKTGKAFNIVVESLPFANDVSISRQCDGAAGDDSQDGVFPFDTSDIQQTLLNGQTDVTTYYYDNNDNFIGNVLPNPFESISQTLRIRVENNTDQKCFDETTLEFIVDDSPEVYDVVIEPHCDGDDSYDDTDGFDLFDTSTITQTLLTNPQNNQTQSLDDFSVSYQYVDDNGVTQNSSELPNPFNSNTQTVIATVTNNINNSCVITKDIDFVVESLPFANDVSISRQCDGAAGDDSQDGVFPFDTSDIQQTLLNGQTDVTTYYYDNNDNFIGNVLPNPFESISQTLRIRVENNTDQKCFDETTLEFIVDDSPEVYDVIIEPHCDGDDSYDDTDGFDLFDTSTITQTLLTNPQNNQTQSLDDFSVSYQYVDDNGVTQNSSELPNPFNSNTQTVIATVTNNINNSCVITKDIDFVVNPLPIIKQNLIVVEQCDDDESNDGITLHNLTEYEELFSNNYQNEIFEYYSDEALSIKIDDPTNYYNVALEDLIWVKIISENGCERISKTQSGDDRLQIDITVGASQISQTFIDDNNTLYSICDDDFGTAQDGVSVFSISVLQDIVEKLRASREIFQNQNIRISLHTNPNDGLTGDNPIDLDSDFTNSNPYNQEIWARVVNVDITTFTCLGYEKVAELFVEPRPIAYPVSIDRQCDGDSVLDLNSQDGFFPFDTSEIINQLLTDPSSGIKQDESALTISYFNEDGSEIPSSNFSPVFLTESQTITLRVEINPVYPNINNPQGLCYDETTLEFIVDDSPEVGVPNVPEQCDSEDGLLDGQGVFDTGNLNTELLAGQTNMELNYFLIDGAGNETDLGTSLPNPFNTSTVTVLARILNPDNPTCIVEEYITFQVNENPVFELPEEQVYCTNLGSDTIYVTTPSATYNYSWTRDNNGVDEPMNQFSQNLVINQGGVYTVTATNPTTGCTTSKTISVSESELALLDYDDITVYDLTGDGTNRIEIQTGVDNLGIGDYEFAFNDGSFQDSPVFDDVEPGIHKISVKDKNGCGIAEIMVSVIGYKYFFTPNSDGINDTWQVLGISEQFQAESLIYIFDRHGRLLTQIATDGEGWDGTYNGSALPADDYWFRVNLEDGRSFTGNFSLIR